KGDIQAVAIQGLGQAVTCRAQSARNERRKLPAQHQDMHRSTSMCKSTLNASALTRTVRFTIPSFIPPNATLIRIRIPSIPSPTMFGFLVRPAVQFADSVADQQPNSMPKQGTYILASHRTQSNGSDGIDPRRSRHSVQSMRVATSGMTKCYSTIPRRASLALCEGFFVRTI